MTRGKKIAIAVGLVLLALVLVIVNLPRPQTVGDIAPALATLADGTYTGECSNGLVQVKVAVEVQDHAIAAIQLLEHRNGIGQAAEALPAAVVDAQSLTVDAVAGATASSGTILKAIENALTTPMEGT